MERLIAVAADNSDPVDLALEMARLRLPAPRGRRCRWLSRPGRSNGRWALVVLGVAAARSACGWLATPRSRRRPDTRGEHRRAPRAGHMGCVDISGACGKPEIALEMFAGHSHEASAMTDPSAERALSRLVANRRKELDEYEVLRFVDECRSYGGCAEHRGAGRHPRAPLWPHSRADDTPRICGARQVGHRTVATRCSVRPRSPLHAVRGSTLVRLGTNRGIGGAGSRRHRSSRLALSVVCVSGTHSVWRGVPATARPWLGWRAS